MVRLFEDLGGRLELNAEVARIELEAGRAKAVITGDGRRFDTDAVASNADVVNTYKQLLGHEERGRDEAKRLSGKRFSMSLFVIHFGLKCRHEHLQHHTVCFGPRYRELIDEIFKRETLADDFHSTCTRPASPIPRWRRKAAPATTCWHRCRTWARRISTGRRRGRSTATASSSTWSGTTCRGCVAIW